eukprot:GILI01053480.1.p1 GENE.GILI01053480.1~~GILI01053480.1.p1  ORF type:complete len:345 (-),score=76.29 GILI01053480.1:11-919(-)
MPGEILARKGVRAKFPVLLIPGFISSALEVWEPHECGKPNWFRERIWMNAPRFLSNPLCWLIHMSLSEDGMDPEGIKVRAWEGLKAADYAEPTVPGMKEVSWIWGKIIHNLAQIGYDSNNLNMASFDWRLAPRNMQKRDKWFSKLRNHIESAQANNDGLRVVVICHSLGMPLFLYFLQWVESPLGANLPGWSERHIESVVNIAGSLLGTPKSMRMLLTGEMDEFAYMPKLLLQPSDIKLLGSTWGSMAFSLPRGGRAVWGDALMQIKLSSPPSSSSRTVVMGPHQLEDIFSAKLANQKSVMA